jgi:hypothetical protein
MARRSSCCRVHHHSDKTHQMKTMKRATNRVVDAVDVTVDEQNATAGISAVSDFGD